MTRNVGTLDRVARLVIGVALLGLYGALESPGKYLTLVGLIFIATAVTAACPLYGVLGWSTRKSQSEEPPHGASPPEGHSSRAPHDPANGDRTWPPTKPPPWRPSDSK